MADKGIARLCTTAGPRKSSPREVTRGVWAGGASAGARASMFLGRLAENLGQDGAPGGGSGSGGATVSAANRWGSATLRMTPEAQDESPGALLRARKEMGLKREHARRRLVGAPWTW